MSAWAARALVGFGLHCLARLSRLDGEGQHVSGDRPSKTVALHRRIVAEARKSDPATRCVLHTHSTYCVLLSLQPGEPELLPPITPYFVMKVGRVPRIACWRPGATEAVEEASRSVTDYRVAGRPLRALMLDRLGPVAWHESPAAAMAVLEELEETCKLWFHSHPKPAPLEEQAIDALRTSFQARW